MSYAEDGSVLWAWQVQEADGRWGIISMTFQRVSDGTIERHEVLVGRSEQRAVARDQEIALMHHLAEGKPIRLARFQLEEVVDRRGGAAHG